MCFSFRALLIYAATLVLNLFTTKHRHMRFSWFQVGQYLKYLTTARTKYYIHSPFVYELCEQVIYDRRLYYAFETIEQLRLKLLKSEKIIEVTDYGAGSATGELSKLRSVQKITKFAATPPKVGRLLFRLVNYLKPVSLLELGTSVGLGTLYMAAANLNAMLTTIEGCPNTAKIAQQNFASLQTTNIRPSIGNFDHVLPQILPDIDRLDLVFIDGNHRFKPTVRYFEALLPKMHPNSVMIFDDIHLSPDMVKAWNIIQNHPSVTLTIDLFKVGLVFFRQDRAKENFTLFF